MKRFLEIATIVICVFLSLSVYADDRIKQIESKLNSLTTEIPGLEETVELSVSGVSIQEFMRGLADAHKLNVSVDPSINQSIVNNFVSATVSDVLIFICKEYNLDINFIGSIMSIVKYEKPKEVTVKMLNIDYNSSTDKLSLDLKNNPIDEVVRIITQKSNKNVVLASGVAPKEVSVYIQDMAFDNALENMGVANDLEIVITKDNTYIIQKTNVEQTNSSTNFNSSPQKNTAGTNKKVSGFSYEVKKPSEVSVIGVDVLIEDVIKNVSKDLGIDYFFVSEIKDKTTINVKSTTFNELLDNMFNGTNLTYDIKNGIYVFGKRETEGLRVTKVIQLQHRSVEKVLGVIPDDIKKGVDVKEFVDLNSLILSGSHPQIVEIENFIFKIDKIVPVVLIEVMIVDYSSNRTNTTGIEMGLGENPATTKGTVFPEANMNLSSTSINNLIESFNGYGILNLGKVTPNFYLNIKALETQGVLRVKSTPKLATLNGNEATMKIGNTEYYVEQTTNTLANQTTQTINTRVYKSVNADLAVTIKPFVSGDDQITMEISVSQSDFTEKIEPGAPPGTVSRDFTSLIRVKDQEMILLGGLEEKAIRESGRGVPFLSRIPIIKWFFSSRSREKSKSKLNIFIKPTVIY
ncbi:MAG: type II and III secretion system protein [Bacteroidetes bacterium]|nr:type II and III secretion system protein [Bacteroidota bacterium]